MNPHASGPGRAGLPADGWDRATLALLLAAALAVAGTFRHYGSTWDERYQRAVGEAAVAWWTSGGADRRALGGSETGNLHLYGGLFEGAEELAGAWLPFDPVETRHLVNALVALAGVAGAALLSRRLGGARAGFFAVALLLTTPPWWGQGFGNSKDVPFAAAYPWLILAFLRLGDALPRPALRRVLLAGLALGVGLAARPGGSLLLVPLAVGLTAIRAAPGVAGGGADRWRAVASVSLRFGAALAIAWGVMLVAWPYGLTHPLSGPIEAVTSARSHPWKALVRFAGGWYPSTALPRSYAPAWLLATLPESWLVITGAGVAAAVLAWRRDRLRPRLEPVWLDRGLLAVAGFGPVLAAVVTRPVLYDGVRHFLFILPPLAALGGWALSAAIERLPRWGGRAAVAGATALAALAVADAIRLHPYEYVYFNRAIAGGLARASGDYELDYWSAAAREAMGWVARNVTSGRSIAIATTADRSVAFHWIEKDAALRRRFDFDAASQPDLRLASTRWYEHRSTGRVLHVVERMGVPLLYVLDVAPVAETPVVLEAGDLAVVLPPAPGWVGEAVIAPGDERAAYELRREIGVPAKVEAWVLSPRSGPVPAPDALRAEVGRLAAVVLGPERGGIEPQPLDGPEARGWAAVGLRRGDDGAMFAGVVAVRVGEAALVVIAQDKGDAAKAGRDLTAWIAGARLASEAERRRP